MQQEQTVYEDIYAALADVVRATGGLKKVGSAMRAELSAEAAGNWLKDCLNPDRREKLDPMQVMFLLRRGREAGVHSAAAYINQEIGYQPPIPVSNEKILFSAIEEMKFLQQKMEYNASVIARLAAEHPEVMAGGKSK